jgi:predicted amidohydrolase YtcJ
MLAAVERRTASGTVLGNAETLSPERAVELFTTPLDAPGAAPRRIAEHQPADLCVLTKPWAQVRESFSSSYVATTVRTGVVTYRKGNPTLPVT